jgi:hypothetical protein
MREEPTISPKPWARVAPDLVCSLTPVAASANEAGNRIVVVKTDSFIVIDGLLDADQKDRLWNYFQMQPFQRAEALEMRGHLLAEESAVLRGPTVGWGHAFDAEYPTETVVDELMKGVVDCEDLIAPIVGKRGPDWAVFSATPSIHVAGQGEAWHRDADNRAGSWVYYAHAEWNVEWGGELLLSHEKDIPPEYGVYLHRLRPMADLPEPPAWRSHLDNQDASQLLMSGGIGSFVFPKPNRLVVVKSGTPYAIAKTRPSAGRHVRASFGGFFLRAA